MSAAHAHLGGQSGVAEVPPSLPPLPPSQSESELRAPLPPPPKARPRAAQPIGADESAPPPLRPTLAANRIAAGAGTRLPAAESETVRCKTSGARRPRPFRRLSQWEQRSEETHEWGRTWPRPHRHGDRHHREPPRQAPPPGCTLSPAPFLSPAPRRPQRWEAEGPQCWLYWGGRGGLQGPPQRPTEVGGPGVHGVGGGSRRGFPHAAIWPQCCPNGPPPSQTPPLKARTPPTPPTSPMLALPPS